MVQTYIVPDLTIFRLIIDHFEEELKLEAVFNLMVKTKHSYTGISTSWANMKLVSIFLSSWFVLSALKRTKPMFAPLRLYN